MGLSRDDILAAAKRHDTREVDVPELSGKVRVRGLSSKEWDAHQQSMRVFAGGEQVGIDENNMSARLMVRCLVDDTGARLLTDADADVFGELPVAAVNKIAEVVFELSGMTEKSLDAIEGNSEPPPGGDPSSESPATATEQPPES